MPGLKFFAIYVLVAGAITYLAKGEAWSWALTIFCGFAGGVFWEFYYLSDQTKSLETQIKASKEKVGRVDQLETRAASISSTVESLRNDIETVSSTIESLRKDIETIRSYVVIAIENPRVDGLKKEMARINTELKNITAKLKA